jgi:hypothetical protein
MRFDNSSIEFEESLTTYRKSPEFGFRPGSFDKNPKTNSEIKNVTTVYTPNFNVSIRMTKGKS